MPMQEYKNYVPHAQGKADRRVLPTTKIGSAEGSLGPPQASPYKTPNGVVFSFLFFFNYVPVFICHGLCMHM